MFRNNRVKVKTIKTESEREEKGGGGDVETQKEIKKRNTETQRKIHNSE